MKKSFVLTGVLVVVLAAWAPATAQTSAGKAADCSTYARNRVDSEASGGEALRSGVRGGVGGALFGAIVGGKKGAKRGALLGGGLGMLKGGARSERERENLYREYFDACMRDDFR